MKKILSVILALAMMIMPMTAFADVITSTDISNEAMNPISDAALAESAKYDTSAFEGAPGYIIQDVFSNVGAVDALNTPSGWYLDKRGGQISGAENQRAQLIDTDSNHVVSMTKDLMPHKTGKITLEATFAMEKKTESGFYYELTGEGKTVFKIITEKDKLAVLQPDGTTKQIGTYRKADDKNLKNDNATPFKVVLDMDTKTYDMIYEGKSVGVFKFADQTATQIDQITVSTGKETTMTVRLRFIYMYVNYAVNDTFMAAPEGVVPHGWEKIGGGPSSVVTFDGNQVWPDTFSLYLDDATAIDGVKLVRKFDDISGKVAFESRFLVDRKSADATIAIGNGNQNAITIKTTANDLVMGNGTVLRANYYDNFWYTLKVIADTNTKKADIYLNYQKVLSDVPFEQNVSSFNTLTYDSPVKKIIQMKIDDVAVYNYIIPSDYAPKPQPVKPDGDYEVGMQMYSMWNEGNHWGWDWITSWPNRITYLGTYAEGKPEVADWVTKWQVEHGFTFRTEIFSRAAANKNQPVKLPTRHHALYGGYLNSQYKDDIKFSILMCGMSTDSIGGVEDMKQNIIPHIMENFFTQPNYLVYENKPVVFTYAGQFVTLMGGKEQTVELIDYWNNECKKMGFDGIIIAENGQSGVSGDLVGSDNQAYAYSYSWQYDARNSQKQMARNDLMAASGANIIANVTMGWGRNPWTEKDAGEIFSEPVTTYETILGIKEKMKTDPNYTKMILMTCWDEYGEGHFFCPTRVHGFGYLNAVRAAVTGQGPRTQEEIPTAKALARMDSLYRADRRALKLVVERDAPTFAEELVDRSRLQVLAEWDFEKLGHTAGWMEYQDTQNVRYENGALWAEATARDPGVWVDGLNIPAEDIQMIRITALTEGAGQGSLYYQTTADAEMGVAGKRFEVSQLDGTQFVTYEAYPYDREKLKGNLTAIRWDPRNDGYPTYKNYAIKKIEILGYHDDKPAELPPVGLTYNGAALKITRPPHTKDGVMYMAIARPLHEMGVKSAWHYGTGTYEIEVDDKYAVLTNGSNIMKLNGVDVDLGAPVYYEEGNLFVPLRSTMEALGITVNWNQEKYGIDLVKVDPNDTYNYQAEPDASKPFSWMFETRQNENWKASADIGLFKTQQGALTVEVVGQDPVMSLSGIKMPASDYKYLKIRMKNQTDGRDAYMFFTTATNTSVGGGKKYDVVVSTNDTEFKEYIVDLSSCEFWKAGETITSLRFDPVNNPSSGKVYIDSIEFLKELPQ